MGRDRDSRRSLSKPLEDPLVLIDNRPDPRLERRVLATSLDPIRDRPANHLSDRNAIRGSDRFQIRRLISVETNRECPLLHACMLPGIMMHITTHRRPGSSAACWN